MADTRILRVLLCSAILSASAGLATAQEASAPAEAPVAGEEQNAADPAPRPGIAGGHSQAAFIAAHDLNGDGKVSLEEVLEKRTARYKAADTNGDGKYTEEEYLAEYEGRLKQQLAEQNREMDPERYAASLKQAGVRFNLLDRDRDGILTLEEDLASATKTFEHNDTDGDGFVTSADPKPERDQFATPADQDDDEDADAKAEGAKGDAKDAPKAE